MKTNKSGFSLIDIIVATAILGLVFFTIYQLFIISIQASYSRTNKLMAAQIAREGIEVIRTMRNNSWSSNLGSLTSSTNYYLNFNDDWEITTVPSPIIDGLFNRTIIFGDVYRDANDNISGSGTFDSNTKKLTTTITWTEQGKSKNFTLETYITNFLDN